MTRTDTWKALTEPVDKKCDNCYYGTDEKYINDHCSNCYMNYNFELSGWKWDK